jgi:ubiquitin-conjugating enzyme E2 Z
MLQTTGGGRVRFNPNLYSNGKVCLSILGTWSGPSWSPVQTLSSVLLSIQSLMNEKPYHNEPGFERPNSSDSQNYNDCIRHETIRVAVIEALNQSQNTVPQSLFDVITSLFPSFYESYEITCISNLSKSGQKMRDPFNDPGWF